ncbi:MAG: DUF1840 domain-containing protein [Rhodoferax sp.]|nr:DUF1840 domain-containing protein [Rhodoferax sp.]
MLYKFKSKVTGEVIMLQANGQRMLEIIGKHTAAEPSVKGILLPEHMAQALQALKDAVETEEAQHKEAMAQAQAEKLPAPRFEPISLRQRSLPFMAMIRQCLQEDAAITWGV